MGAEADPLPAQQQDASPLSRAERQKDDSKSPRKRRPPQRPRRPAPRRAAAPARRRARVARVWRSAKDPRRAHLLLRRIDKRDGGRSPASSRAGGARRLDDERERRKFFDEMERNIRANIAAGLSSADGHGHTSDDERPPVCGRPPPRPRRGPRAHLVYRRRLVLVRGRDASRRSSSRSTNRGGRSVLKPRRGAKTHGPPITKNRRGPFDRYRLRGEGRSEGLRGAAADRADAQQERAERRHRNSTGTMFVSATLESRTRGYYRLRVSCAAAHLAAAEAQPQSGRSRSKPATTRFLRGRRADTVLHPARGLLQRCLQ